MAPGGQRGHAGDVHEVPEPRSGHAGSDLSPARGPEASRPPEKRLQSLTSRPAPPAEGSSPEDESLVTGPVGVPVPESSSPPSWRRMWERREIRGALLGLAALIQAIALFAAGAWWSYNGDPTVAPVASAPLTWTGVVHDVGPAGVYLRALPEVGPDTARDTAARGARLQVICGQTGQTVTRGDTNSGTWLKTADGLFVSLLYVRITERPTIISCAGNPGDLPLISVTDPGQAGAPADGPGTAEATGPLTCGATGACVAADGRRVAQPTGREPGASPRRGTASSGAGGSTGSRVGEGVASQATPSPPNSSGSQGGGQGGGGQQQGGGQEGGGGGGGGDQGGGSMDSGGGLFGPAG
jgi:hypothetical protein